MSKSKFLKHLKEQQGSAYVKDQGYLKAKLEEIKQFEEDHYSDFKRRKRK